jgi:hypothetical protein
MGRQESTVKMGQVDTEVTAVFSLSPFEANLKGVMEAMQHILLPVGMLRMFV